MKSAPKENRIYCRLGKYSCIFVEVLGQPPATGERTQREYSGIWVAINTGFSPEMF